MRTLLFTALISLESLITLISLTRLFGVLKIIWITT